MRFIEVAVSFFSTTIDVGKKGHTCVIQTNSKGSGGVFIPTDFSTDDSIDIPKLDMLVVPGGGKKDVPWQESVLLS